jgi:hypothetical protein
MANSKASLDRVAGTGLLDRRQRMETNDPVTHTSPQAMANAIAIPTALIERPKVVCAIPQRNPNSTG